MVVEAIIVFMKADPEGRLLGTIASPLISQSRLNVSQLHLVETFCRLTFPWSGLGPD